MKTFKTLFCGAVAALVVASAIAGDLPDSQLTPGAINPDITQANYPADGVREGIYQND